MRPGGNSQIMNLELFDRIKVGNTLGEGVIWDHRTETIWWTDIQESRLYHYNPSSKKLGHYDTPERLCSFGFTDDEKWFIAAFENGFAKYNPEKNILKWLSKPLEHHNQIRFNDGRVDRQGRFWSGTMVEDNNGGDARGRLYRLDLAEKKLAVPLLEDILISNSLCWSPDSKKMYFADSTNNRIDVYDFDAALGIPTNDNTFAITNEDIFQMAQQLTKRAIFGMPSGVAVGLLDMHPTAKLIIFLKCRSLSLHVLLLVGLIYHGCL